MNMNTDTGRYTDRMSNEQIRENLRGVRPGMIADFIESAGWTLQETTENHLDIWTKWFGGEVSEILLPEPGMGNTDAADCPRARESVRELARLENLSPRYILQKIAPHRFGPEPLPVILEDVMRSGIRHAMTERLAREVLGVMERQTHGDPPELSNLLWEAHRSLVQARDLLEQAEQHHAGRLAERLADSEPTANEKL